MEKAIEVGSPTKKKKYFAISLANEMKEYEICH